ncbi:atrial natriuretic peptide receptor 1-like [Gigantopelta aegis]|uniref:atrial natriuretic peptide receptor 1-like n=1 Tax=Gigantopelta aegis TaxID=1735272 RepID=UPI001B88AB01|nr:atrial natriuretic peptide receptor 1-like [Gigantopelta aegis]
MATTIQWITNTCLVLFFTLCVVRLSDETIEVKGAGASFPLDVYTSWIPAYETYRRRFQDVHISYSSIGSGKGKARIKGELQPRVDYAGSDSLLSDRDYRDSPDLQMFPTMAGAVVCVFNLPGISQLNMTIHQLARIYSGRITWWNDSSLVEINPEITLPNKKIITTARRDKSGTTEIFTRTLSSFDADWKLQYGMFNQGLDENDRPVHWNSTTVQVYGQSNRGLSGMMLSIRYSIGYLVMSEATSMKLSYALLQNNASQFVDPTITTVQNAMVATSSRFDNRMTASLSNPTGSESYPMAGYTYFIIKKSNMTDCQVAKELVRYIEWFYTNPVAKEYCSGAGMVPLPYDLYKLILSKIIQKVTCNNRNVYNLVQEDIQRELDSLRTWVIPVYVAAPLFGVLVLVAAICVINMKTKTCRAVWNNEWKIEPWEINFYHLSPRKSIVRTGKFARFTRNKIHPAVANGKTAPTTSTFSSCLGEWCGNLVYLRALGINKNLTFNTKKTVLWMERSLRHKNLTRFYGLVYLDGVYHSVMNYNVKGSLNNFLYKSNLSTSIDLKFAITYELACGMTFLHRNNIVHGSLSSSNCYFDSNWSLRIDEWGKDRLEDRTNRKNYNIDDISNITQWDSPEFWTAPEILQHNTQPTKSGDVYSFGMTMKEIFTRELPFSEYSSCRTPGEVLRDVISVSLRPGFYLTTPFTARAIMSITWESDPGVRPTFSLIQEKIMKTYSRGNAVVDSIIHLLEEYVSMLEETIETVEARDKIVTNRDSNNCPTIKTLPSLEKVQPQKFSSVTVVVCNACDFLSLVSRFTSADIFQMLTNLFQAFDDIALKNQLYTFDVTYNCCKMVAGLPKPSNIHAQIAVQTALDLMAVTRKIRVNVNTLEPLRLKIGISSGTVFLSSSGVCSYPEKRFVCGDAVYVATQLAEEAKPSTLLISQTTAELLQSTAKWNVIPRRDPFMWKGDLLKTFWLQTNNNLFNLTTV